MVTMTKYELGVTCLTILQFKIHRNGMELRPEMFEQKVQKIAKLLNLAREEVVFFFKKYLLPEILAGCNLGARTKYPEPNEREAWLAYRILKIEHFWELQDLRTEVRRIVDRTSLDFEDVAAIAIHIAQKHVCDQFGEGDDVKLNITDERP